MKKRDYRHILILSLLCIILLSFSSCKDAGSTAGESSKEAESSSKEVNQTIPLDTTPLLENGNEVLKAMGNSYSAKDFVDGEVEIQDIELILKAAQKAPSAKNAQPWHFTVITDYDIGHELLDAVKRGSALIVISGNPDIITDTLSFDCGLAAGYMQLAAESLGYGARWYLQAVKPVENRRQELDIPKGYSVQSVLLVGKTDDAVDVLSGATKRRSIEENSNWIEAKD